MLIYHGEADVKLDDNDEVKILTDEQRKLIIDAALNMSDKRLITLHTTILLALATGMREGEILGLMPKYVDLEHKEIKIRKTLDKVIIYDENHNAIGYKLVLADPKTKASVRTIPLPGFIIPILEKYEFGNTVVFETENGTFIDPRNQYRGWERFLKRLKIPPIKFHALRDTYASLLFRSGATLKEVQELLGHADHDTTIKIYISTFPEDKEKRVAQLNSIFSFKTE